MRSIDIVQDGATVTLRETGAGRIELVRQSDHGIAIYFDSPQDAIRRWSVWTLGSASLGRRDSDSSETGQLLQTLEAPR